MFWTEWLINNNQKCCSGRECTEIKDRWNKVGGKWKLHIVLYHSSKKSEATMYVYSHVGCFKKFVSRLEVVVVSGKRGVEWRRETGRLPYAVCPFVLLDVFHLVSLSSVPASYLRIIFSVDLLWPVIISLWSALHGAGLRLVCVLFSFLVNVYLDAFHPPVKYVLELSVYHWAMESHTRHTYL